MDIVEQLIGVSEIAIALAGFTGVVVAFGSRSSGAWHPGDRLRLTFLLEASLTAIGFALLALLLINSPIPESIAWTVSSALWAVFMIGSLWFSRKKITSSRESHGDIDHWSNRLIATMFLVLVFVQIANAILWHDFYPFLAALLLNLAGAAMQFARLIRSAFRDSSDENETTSEAVEGESAVGAD